MDRADLERAAQRLAGNLVRTPVIGGVTLPGLGTAVHVRVKADLLQPSGSSWYRGALHAAQRAFGIWKGLVTHGAVREQLAWLEVARQQRLPVVAVVAPEEAGSLQRLAPVGVCECVVVPGAEVLGAVHGLASGRGFRIAPRAGDPDFDLGLGTLALEIEREVPPETVTLCVGDPELAKVLDRGLRALDSTIAVGVAAPSPPRLAEQAREGLRLDLGPASLAALAMGLSAAPDAAVCAVLSD